MRIAFILLVSPFVLAVACGTRTELLSSEASGTVEEDVGVDESAVEDSGADLGTAPVHCVGTTTAPTTTCSPGSNCFMEGSSIVCGPKSGEVNCGRVNCSGRCSCGGTDFGSWCFCH